MVGCPAYSSGARAFHRGGVADGDAIGGDRFYDDRPGPDDTIRADVGHHDGTVSDPAVRADVHLGERPALVLDWSVGAIEVVLSPAAKDVDVAADRRVAADDRGADGAAVADHHAGAD